MKSVLSVALLPCSEVRMPCSCSWYGRMASMAIWAFRNLALETSFMAEVILRVLRTEAMRPFISFSVGMGFFDFAQNEKITYFKVRITEAAVSVSTDSISGVNLPWPSGSRTSAL